MLASQDARSSASPMSARLAIMGRLFFSSNAKSFVLCVGASAFLLRVLFMVVLQTYQVPVDNTGYFGFGWEMGRVSAALAAGQGFSSPLPLPTGPTAMVGPVYPLMLAAIFKVFGTYSVSSAFVMRILQAMFSALTSGALYTLGARSLNDATGRVAAALWAIFPLNIFFTVERVWETTLVSLLVVVLAYAILRAGETLSLRSAALAGFTLGVAILTSATIALAAFPFGLAVLLRKGRQTLLPLCVLVVACSAVLSPWMLRNRAVFGKAMLRSNFPLEFRVGNNQNSWGEKNEALHPSNTPALNLHWQQVGEAQFMAEDSRANHDYVAQHRGRFLLVTCNRIANYWTGLWILHPAGAPQDFLTAAMITAMTIFGVIGMMRVFSADPFLGWQLAGSILLYPLPYYLTTTQPRFFHAITPLLILAGSFALMNWADRHGLCRADATAAVNPA